MRSDLWKGKKKKVRTLYFQDIYKKNWKENGKLCSMYDNFVHGERVYDKRKSMQTI